MKKIACIVGGTSGIGKDLTIFLLRKKYSVICIGKSSKHANELKKNIQNSDLYVFQGDATSNIFLQKIAKFIDKRFSKLDVLINSAGTISKGGIYLESFEDWNNVLNINLNSVFVTTKNLLNLLEKSKYASIINISSVCSTRTCTSLSYSVSKAGVDMFTKVLAKELGQKNIRVNAVNPSVVKTNLQFSAGLFTTKSEYNKWLEKMTGFHPLKRVGETKDIVYAVDFLISKKASWITGSTLNVDGGRSVI